MSHDRRDELLVKPWLGPWILHESLLAKFEENGFTGYRTRPASLRFRDGEVSREYHELVVTGWAGVARPESGIRVVKSCPACHWKKYSRLLDVDKLIDWDQWTQEDFFMVWPLPLFVLITERVAELLLTLNARSFALAGLEDCMGEMSTGFTVGRLSNFMPEDLAIEYGRPLGLE